MKKKSMTLNQALYKKEIKRITRFVRRAEARGYRFPADIIPQMPKRVTQKALAKIQALKAAELYKKASFLNPETGEIVTGTEGRKLERSAASKKGYETKKKKKAAAQAPAPKPAAGPPKIVDVILKNVEELLAKWQPLASWSPNFQKIKQHDKNVLQSILEGAIKRDGRDVVAKRIEANADQVMNLAQNILYGQSGKFKDQIQDDLSIIAWIINNGQVPDDEAEALLDNEDVYDI